MPTVRRTSGSTAGSPSPRLLPAYLAAIVLGILGMHALAQHCPSPSGSLPLLGASISSSMPAHHAHHAAAAAGTAVEAGASTRVSIAADHGGGGLDDLLRLCAAMLLGAGATVALWLRNRGRTVLRLVSRLRSAVPRPAWLPTAKGPPPVWTFAVVRC